MNKHFVSILQALLVTFLWSTSFVIIKKGLGSIPPITFTQWIQFIGLSLLPSATVSLMLNFTPIIVVVLATIFLNEKPNLRQIAGTTFFIIVGRKINKKRDISPFIVTLVSMPFGSILLLTIGIITEGFPEVSVVFWGYILWLSVINTAFAFTLWNYTLRHLGAMESSIIIGMTIASLGAILVQMKSKVLRSVD